MSPERTHAYRRVMHTLNELGPSKLLGDEQERIRLAADNLIFSTDPLEGPACAALLDAQSLCQDLVESGRWEQVTASRLADDICACGPGEPAELRAA